MSGLFSTPEQIRQQQAAAQLAQRQARQAQNSTRGGLLGGLTGGRAGSMIGQGIADLAGLKSPEEKKAEVRQAILADVNFENPESLREAAAELSKAGLIESAAKLAEKAAAVEADQLKMTLAKNEDARADQKLDLDRDRFGLDQDKFGLSEREFESMDAARKSRIRIESATLKRQEAEDEQLLKDRENKELVNKTIAGVEYNADAKNPLNDYYTRVAQALNSVGEGALAAKYMGMAEDALRGQLGSVAKPIVTKIEDTANPETGEGNGTLVITTRNGQSSEAWYPSSQGGQGLPELSTSMQKEVAKATDASESARTRANKADTLAAQLEQVPDFKGGFFETTFPEAIKDVFGERDITSELLTQATGLRNSEAIGNLPPGVASDKDIEMVLSGVTPTFANKAELQRFARGVAKLARIEADYFADKEQWITVNGDTGGFTSFINNKRALETWYATPQEAIQEFFANYPDNPEAERAAFKRAFGYDPMELQEKMGEYQKNLKILGRGGY